MASRGMVLAIKPENDTILMMYSGHDAYHPGDSGVDLFFPEDVNIPPKTTVVIDFKIQCEASERDSDETDNLSYISYYLYARSSISRTPLRMANSVGIIDAGYRGNIKVAIDNIRDQSYSVEKGQRLFQICAPDLGPIDVELVDELSPSSRGSNGFGSTGGTGIIVDT